MKSEKVTLITIETEFKTYEIILEKIIGLTEIIRTVEPLGYQFDIIMYGGSNIEIFSTNSLKLVYSNLRCKIIELNK